MWPDTRRMLARSDQLMYHSVPAAVPTMPYNNSKHCRAKLDTAHNSYWSHSWKTSGSQHTYVVIQMQRMVSCMSALRVEMANDLMYVKTSRVLRL